MIRLVQTLDTLTVPRIRLDTKPLALALARFTDRLDSRRILTLEIRSDELFEPRVTRHNAPRRRRHPAYLGLLPPSLPWDPYGKEL